MKEAKEVSADRNKTINNRSFIIGIKYAGKKILIPGDIEVEGWEKAIASTRIKKILKGTNFFVASHHGHKSGFTTKVLEYTGTPDIYIVSAKSGDESVDGAYSKKENSKGYLVSGDQKKAKMISTRDRKKSIKITIGEKGDNSIGLVETPDNLSKQQRKKLSRRSRKIMKKWNLGV